MAASKLAIKSRMRSVDSTKKITKAMQLVAASKLKKQKQIMEQNKEYAFYLKETVQEILASIDVFSHPYLQKRQGNKMLTIVFTSDMGLCGGYNANFFRMIQSELSKDDPIIMIGSKGYNWINKRGYHVIDSQFDLEDDCYNELSMICDKVLDLYRKNEISGIQILYTSFINSISFETKISKLLPVEKVKRSTSLKETIFEPDGEQILNSLIPLYVKSLLYSCFLETKTSEHATRRMAMESATDNAEELKATLELQYNQARQAAITQEITEIVGGANAL